MTTAGSRNVGASRRAPGPSLAGPDPGPKSLSSRDEAARSMASGRAEPERLCARVALWPTGRSRSRPTGKILSREGRALVSYGCAFGLRALPEYHDGAGATGIVTRCWLIWGAQFT
jgi:hypothetical protein